MTTKRDTYSDIMVDIETQGLREDCVIMQIGITAFNREPHLEDMESFEILLDWEHQLLPPYSRTQDKGTLDFWNREGGFSKLYVGKGQPVTINVAKLMFRNMIKLCSNRNTVVWAKGQDFDIPKLRSLFGGDDSALPWRFYLSRDMRTMIDVAEFYGFDRECAGANENPHCAVADSYHQAKVMRAAFKYLHKRLNLPVGVGLIPNA